MSSSNQKASKSSDLEARKATNDHIQTQSAAGEHKKEESADFGYSIDLTEHDDSE